MITGAVVLGAGVVIGWLLTLVSIAAAQNHNTNKEN